MLTDLVRKGNTRPVTLFFGARSSSALYDLADLRKMAAQWQHLEVTAVAEADDAGTGCVTGTVADVIAARGIWREHDAYVCGSSAMVQATVNRLRSLGTPEERIFVEDFGWSSW